MRRNRLYSQEPPGIDKKSSITYELISLFGKCNNAPILVEISNLNLFPVYIKFLSIENNYSLFFILPAKFQIECLHAQHRPEYAQGVEGGRVSRDNRARGSTERI